MTRARRVHVVGCQRSGTTLMMELLWSSFEFSGRAEHEISLFQPVPPGETLYLTKKPPDTIRLEPAFLADEELFVIAMQRDPRSVVSSRHPSRPNVYFSGFRRWRDCAVAIERLQDHPRYLVVRYEDLVTDPDRVQAEIARRFPFLRQRGRFSDYPRGADVPEPASQSLLGVRPFDPSRVQNWRDHLSRVKGQLLGFPEMQDFLERLGYEPDAAWTGVLDGVTPYYQTYKEAAPHRLKRLETRLRFWLKTRRYLRERGC